MVRTGKGIRKYKKNNGYRPKRLSNQPYVLKRPLRDSTLAIKLHYIITPSFSNGPTFACRPVLTPDGYIINNSSINYWSGT